MGVEYSDDLFSASQDALEEKSIDTNIRTVKILISYPSFQRGYALTTQLKHLMRPQFPCTNQLLPLLSTETTLTSRDLWWISGLPYLLL